ncbi:oogenesis-related [Betta splendens]|uniref:Oogenesis-related n=1 Tax=Betta splendens TaxID=158456 RepID=A0A6P7MAE6_BETSP|nr:oogenesis-related [Betta splendens]
MSEARRDAVEQEQPEHIEDVAVGRRGVLGSVVNGLLWPFSIVARAYRRFWLFLGFRQPRERALVSPARHSLTGRKRLHWLTRVLLSLVPRWVQRSLGYTRSSSIGRALSPEVRVSPTKPCGKGSKRKQDELDEDEEEEGQQTWVEALTQELADDVGSEEDPDYEPSTVETESEEYRSHNDTESDLEVEGKGPVLIKDVNTDVAPSTQAQMSSPAV